MEDIRQYTFSSLNANKKNKLTGEFTLLYCIIFKRELFGPSDSLDHGPLMAV